MTNRKGRFHAMPRFRAARRLLAFLGPRVVAPTWPDPARARLLLAEVGDPTLVDRLRDVASATSSTPERLASLGIPVMAAFRAAAFPAADRAEAWRPPSGRTRRTGRPVAMRLALVAVALLAVATAGTTALASSGPGQALYTARLSVESTLLVAFQGSVTGGRVTWLENRLSEAEAAARSGSDGAMESALGAYVDGLAVLARSSPDPDRSLAARLDAEIGRLRALKRAHDEDPVGAGIVRRALHAAVALRLSVGGPMSHHRLLPVGHARSPVR